MFYRKTIKELTNRIRTLEESIEVYEDLLRFLTKYDKNDIVATFGGVRYVYNTCLKMARFNSSDVVLVDVLENNDDNAILKCRTIWTSDYTIYKLEKAQNALFDITEYYTTKGKKTVKVSTVPTVPTVPTVESNVTKDDTSSESPSESESEPAPIKIPKKISMQKFSELIRVDRHKRNLDLRTYAKQLDIPYSTMYGYEKGRCMPKKSETLTKILKYIMSNQ